MVSFKDIRIKSMSSSTGVFAGHNLQCRWCSDTTVQTGFGRIIGEGNILESPCNTITDPDSSSPLLQYFEDQVSSRIGKRGI